jgi:hypothetical protein
LERGQRQVIDGNAFALDEPRAADRDLQLGKPIGQQRLDMSPNLIVHADVEIDPGRHGADERHGQANLKEVPTEIDQSANDDGASLLMRAIELSPRGTPRGPACLPNAAANHGDICAN